MAVALGVGTLIGIGVGIGVGVLSYVLTEVVEVNDTSFVEWIDSLW